MCRVVRDGAGPKSRLFVLLAVVVAVLLLAAPASASSASSPPDLASPAAVDAALPTLTCVLSSPTIVYGGTVKVTGTLTAATPDQPVEGQAVVITVNDTEVTSEATRPTTGADGSFTFDFPATESGDVVASLAGRPEVASAPQPLVVKVKASVSHGTLVPFLVRQWTVKVLSPGSNGARVAVKVVHHGIVVGRYTATVSDGRAALRFPLRGVDVFTITFTLPAAPGLAGGSVVVKVSLPPKTLSAGSNGQYVKGMLTGLQRLAIRIPTMTTSFDSRVKDSVMAFQKAYRLSRTYVFNSDCWRKLDGAVRVKPRYASPSTHLEVDKGRQILMVVKGGKVAGLICVSTGATNNTPEGTFHIQQKHPYTTSGYGGILVRTMGFVGNFAIHGYTPVPPYPASHGCVREPIWACYWVYDNSFVGETLYIYH